MQSELMLQEKGGRNIRKRRRRCLVQIKMIFWHFGGMTSYLFG
jgi:hypothetical protein